MKRQHYYGDGMQVIDVIQLFGLGFERGNMIKYIARAGLKDPNKIEEDLDKACTYFSFYSKKYTYLRRFFINLKYWYIMQFKKSKVKAFGLFLDRLESNKQLLTYFIVSGAMRPSDKLMDDEIKKTIIQDIKKDLPLY